VVLGDDGGGQAGDGGLVGEDAHDVGAALELLVEPLQWVRRPDLAPVSNREAAKANRSSLESLSMVATWGNWRPNMVEISVS
jgi:hypothetical protein